MISQKNIRDSKQIMNQGEAKPPVADCLMSSYINSGPMICQEFFAQKKPFPINKNFLDIIWTIQNSLVMPDLIRHPDTI
jgi:hypothetical protein